MEFRSCIAWLRRSPLTVSQAPSRRKGIIAAAAHNLAWRGAFASGSQRNRLAAIRKATRAQTIKDAIYAPRLVAAAWSIIARCKPLTRYVAGKKTAKA